MKKENLEEEENEMVMRFTGALPETCESGIRYIEKLVKYDKPLLVMQSCCCAMGYEPKKSYFKYRV